MLLPVLKTVQAAKPERRTSHYHWRSASAAAAEKKQWEGQSGAAAAMPAALATWQPAVQQLTTGRPIKELAKEDC